jgi:hypothetical protein
MSACCHALNHMNEQQEGKEEQKFMLVALRTEGTWARMRWISCPSLICGASSTFEMKLNCFLPSLNQEVSVALYRPSSALLGNSSHVLLAMPILMGWRWPLVTLNDMGSGNYLCFGPPMLQYLLVIRALLHVTRIAQYVTFIYEYAHDVCTVAYIIGIIGCYCVDCRNKHEIRLYVFSMASVLNHAVLSYLNSGIKTLYNDDLRVIIRCGICSDMLQAVT